jgi:SAM-dependent methyltransferase
MNHFLTRTRRFCSKLLKTASFDRNFRADFKLFRALSREVPHRFPSLSWKDRYPCIDDNTERTDFDHHYTYHLAWAARLLARLKPAYHVDIASSLYFSTIASAFVPMTFYDYRPVNLQVGNLDCKFADLCALPFEDNSVPSLSCMHVVEHVGLGRYGDPIDPIGDLRAIAELKRVLANGGSLLFVVPIGKPRIQFNAHRIYGFRQIIKAFSGLKLVDFALIPDQSDDGAWIPNATEEMADQQLYGCGCFLFSKDNPPEDQIS